MKISKFTISIFTCTCFALHAKSQQMIATVGGYHETETLSISWNLDEPVVNTLTGNNIFLT